MTRPLTLNSDFFPSFSEVYIHNIHYFGSLSDRKSTFLETDLISERKQHLFRGTLMKKTAEPLR